MPFRNVAAYQLVCVFIASSFVAGIWVAIENGGALIVFVELNALGIGKFTAVVHRDCLEDGGELVT